MPSGETVVPMQPWFFEDFSLAQRVSAGEVLVATEDAARYAAEFAPRWVDQPACTTSPRSGDHVSGWYVAALGMRLICEAFLNRTASLGSPGIEEMQWPGAVLVGDRLRLDGRVESLRASRSRPTMGLVGFAFTMTNQHGGAVMRQSNIILVQRRAPEVEP